MRYNSKVNFLLILLSFLIFSTSCGRNTRKDVIDYYGEYSFELPFNHIVKNSTDVLYFDTEYSIEQMSQIITEAGYQAELYDSGDTKKILISVAEEPFTYYFVIHDKEKNDDNDSYTLSDAHLVWGYYSILAPINIINESNNSEQISIYESFDYLVKFYESTGKNDFSIDEINKTITFKCHKKPNTSLRDGEIKIHYIEAEEGNVLKITTNNK